MTHDKNAVRKILDRGARRQARGSDRSRGAGRLRGVRHHHSQGGCGEERRGRGQARLRHRFPGRHENRLAADTAQDRSGRRHGRRQVGAKPRRTRTPPSSANAKKYDGKAEILGVQVQQMLTGGQEVIIGAVTDPAFGKLVAFGLGGILVEVLKDITFRLAPATNEDALSMLDGIAAAEILRGVRGAKPVHRAALAGDDREGVGAGRGLSGNFGNGPESRVRHRSRRDRGRRAHRARFQSGSGARSTEPGGHRREDDPHHEAEGGGGDRRLGRGRQDRQFRDEESDQRRLPGRDLSDPSEGRQHHGQEGLQERQGRAGRHRRRGVRHSGEIRRAGADRGGREENRRRHSRFLPDLPRPAMWPGRTN